MSLNKFSLYYDILLRIIEKKSVFIKTIKTQFKMSHDTLYKLFKLWMNEGYIKRLKISSEFGGITCQYHATEKLVNIIKERKKKSNEILKIEHEFPHQDMPKEEPKMISEPISMSKKKTSNEKRDLINKILINMSSKILDSLQELLEDLRTRNGELNELTNETFNDIQSILKQELENVL